ncbi:nucleolar protein 11-like [Saccostrea echinata]|uniref:nucleolar protein 11-like n=1 Tax=Saccostrea echinata TaxID=191078 RepID=UPI002A7F11B6|nr:nucleolar protein 11-like [Saccostrea echinata]
MAASRGEPVVLAEDIKDSNILNVDACCTEGDVIVTQSSNLINLYKIDDQKATQSWSTKHNEHITSSVIWSEHDQKFITVINERTIRTWEQHEQNFEKSATKNAICPIKGILPGNTTEPVVVFKNGAVTFLSKVKDIKEGPLIDKDEILFCDLVKINSDLCVLCLLQQENNLQLMSHWYRNEEWIRHSEPVQMPINTEFVSCHTSLGRDNVKIFILCLNGDLLCQTLTFHQSSSEVLQTISGVTKATKMVALNSTHIVLAGCVKDNQEIIGIFDIKFGTYEIWKNLPTLKKSTVKLFVLHGHLFVLCHRTLYMYSYSCHPSTLSSILGHQRVDMHIQHDPASPGPLTWSKSKSPSPNTEANKLFSELQNIYTCKTQKEFEKKFSNILKSHGDDASGVISETSVMEQIVQRCVSDEKFWPHNILEQLLLHRLVPSRCIKDIAEGLVKHEDLALLLQCLDSVEDIPEESLCVFTNFVLSIDDAKVSEAVKLDGYSGTSKSNQPLSEGKGHIINKIIKKSYNDIFIIECLHHVTFQNVLMLLEYLCYLINNRESNSNAAPDLTQIVNFVCVLIDAHYQQLVISPDSHGVLINLHSIVEKQREYFAEFLTLDVLLSQLKRQFAIPRPRTVGKYCMEVLHVY